MNWKISPAELFNASPVVPVMVIKALEDALPMAAALADAGINLFEITLRTDAALEAITAIRKELPHALVGAGTILNSNQYQQAMDAGAEFVISPGFSPELLNFGKKAEAPLIPGVCTPSEIITALAHGYDHLKFFPAEAVGGAKALRAISGPLPQVRFCPTGGIGPHNVADYLAVPSVATIGGSWMLPAELVKEKNWQEIRQLTRDAVNLVNSLKAAH